MNEAAYKIKQQIVDKIKTSTNILITVSRDPSVDELSAALGLTALLNKLDKHVTAIFSGILPPAITFLEPDKVFENNADSLRDFIIALDKEKADHLRYKIEGDVVKIFITPYRTTISEDNLTFSQGDYNIELVLALGVVDQGHLDTTLASQEKIIHNVTIMTLSAGEQISQLGSVDWHNENASGYSEMVTGIVELLATDKPLLDKQISTALLTGIVSATDRFSNIHTSSQVMAIAALLMAAGADQQLIAIKLKESHEINSLPAAAKEDVSVSIKKDAAPDSATTKLMVEQPNTAPGTLLVPHGLTNEAETVIEESKPIEEPSPPTSEPADETPLPQPELVEKIKLTPPSAGSSKNSIDKAKTEITDEPLLGGILNATTDLAAEEAKLELDETQNKTILAHSYLGGSDDGQTNSSSSIKDDLNTINTLSHLSTPTIENISKVSDLPLPPPLPDFSTLPPTSSTLPTSPVIDTSPTEPIVTSTLPPTPPHTNDPTQFQIPM